MQIFVPRETAPGERRVPLVPAAIARLAKLGATVEVERGLGETIGLGDEAYEQAGASVASDRAGALGRAEIVLRLNKPPADEVALLAPGSLHVSYLEPFASPELLAALRDARVTAVSMEMIPRTTLAQKMDALSSQANLGGYVAVVLAADRLDRIFPMMMTPAGTLAPARVFVIGVGVAGLQAIATARRLGARVEAFDTRPVVEEQVRSLGARFVKIDLGDTGQTEQGYAKALTEEQLARQRELMAKHCATADVVITAAQVFGRKAPVIVTTEIIRSMQPGSVVVDLAVDSGGNVECVTPGEETVVEGVRVVGLRNLPGRVPVHASEMYAGNVASFVEHFWDRDASRFRFDFDDEILSGAVVVHDGRIVNDTLRALVE
jgi:NAD(P) transhydrogenase subunit alpha